MHARSGGNLEVMGLMLGKVDGNTMVVMDAFALPVEGTETRVNAQAAAYEYMTQYIESAKKVYSRDVLMKNFSSKQLFKGLVTVGHLTFVKLFAQRFRFINLASKSFLKIKRKKSCILF